MMTLERDGVLLNTGLNIRAHSHVRETIDLPATLVMHDDSLLDRVFDIVYERLSSCVVELRIQPEIAVQAA
jgi:hypothetical protein